MPIPSLPVLFLSEWAQVGTPTPCVQCVQPVLASLQATCECMCGRGWCNKRAEDVPVANGDTFKQSGGLRRKQFPKRPPHLPDQLLDACVVLAVPRISAEDASQMICWEWEVERPRAFHAGAFHHVRSALAVGRAEGSGLVSE